MSTTALPPLRIRPDLKRAAAAAAARSGQELSAVVADFLEKYIRKQKKGAGDWEFSAAQLKRFEESGREAEEEMKTGKGKSFENMKDAIAYLESLK